LNIYWTYKQFSGDEFRNHEHFEKHCVIAIMPTNKGIYWNFTHDKKHHHRAFCSQSEAIDFIEQTNKPNYVNVCGLSYELVFLESNSSEWYEQFSQYESFINQIRGIKNDLERPLWKKLLMIK